MSRVVRQHQRASQFLAGGVSSSTRVNQAVGHAMLFDRAQGCRVWDLDGNEYIDLCTSHGAALLGHGDPRVRAAVEAALDRGAACSYESEIHGELAELLCQSIPCLELVRFTGAGTEATMHCLRLARAFTGRQKLLRFEGNFHGYHDQVMWGTDGELGRLNPPLKPISAGVAAGLGQQIVQVPYNRTDLLEEAFARFGPELAAAIGEPIYFNAGCVLPSAAFIAALRRLTREHGALLIFDEVLSAFRMGVGGAQEYLGITPDLCTLGKAVGGGYPLSVFGGRRDIMQRLMPTGDCQHSGTYNGHPVVVAAGLAAVRAYREPGFYEHIHAIAEQLYGGLRALFARHGITARVQGLGARFGIYFGIPATHEVRSYADAQQHDRAKLMKFYAAAIRHGVYFHDYGGAPCHQGFCAAMQPTDVDEALARLDRAVAEIK
ncbi:MAG: aminotransferase class III-fold pyridoxal phosphate-dependent enzyme [Pirellulaceae bacterium]|nr:aminotransferase class III-fold pyridoxal phosphate-dependent enzyme [Pirellulaceae bacterium]